MPGLVGDAPPCYVLLYAAAHDLVDELIVDAERLRYAADQACYCHAAIMIGDLLVEEQARGPIYLRAAQATTRAEEAAAYSRVPLTAAQAAAGLAYLQAEMGSPYDYPQIVIDAADILTGLHATVHLGRAQVCSGLVTACLQAAGVVPPHVAGSMTPADLASWPGPVIVGPPPLA